MRHSLEKMRAGKSAGSIQSGYSLAQLVRFGFRVSKPFLFCLFWDCKTLRDIRKKKYGLGSQQKALNLDILWHNWFVLGSESPNLFLFCLFWDYKTFRDIRKKNMG
jgi:hypothetical protein